MSDSGPSLIAGEVRSSGPIGPGPKLRAARTAMGVEVREVADALNLPTSMIDAIETNDFAAMPSLVFARGYVRAYAKLVELDPDQIVQAFSQATAPVVEPKAASTITSTMNVSEAASLGQRLGALRTAVENQVREKPLAALGILAAAVVLLMLLLWVIFGGSDPVDVEPSGAVAQVPSAQLPGAQRPATSPNPGIAGAEPAQRGGFTDADVAVSERSVAAPAGAGTNPSQPPLSPADQVRLNDGDDRLRFTFVADCWVEVRATDDSVLYGDLGQSGKQLELIGQGPFKILLGYAPGARLAFNGENVVLGPHTRNDLARLVLGQ